MSQTPLDDSNVDALLSRARLTPERDERISAAVSALVADARVESSHSRVRRGHRWALAAVALVAAAGLVTAGTAIAGLWATTPPYQELPDGWLRTTEPIPLGWIDADGETEDCRIYLDLERATPALIETLDEAIRDHEWTGLGQQLYDSLPGSPVGPNTEADVTDLAAARVMDFARDAIPGLGGFGDSGPAIGAVATTCVPELP